MTKEDYMRLPKERLAELLVEADQRLKPFMVAPAQNLPRLQCCEPGGICTNPFRDCINCRRTFSGDAGVFTTTDTKQNESIE